MLFIELQFEKRGQAPLPDLLFSNFPRSPLEICAYEEGTSQEGGLAPAAVLLNRSDFLGLILGL